MIDNVVVLFGAPGCGKGTQGKHLVAKYNFQHLSTGSLFREQVALKTELGLKVESIMKQGGLISDEDVNLVVADKLKDSNTSGNVLLDGYPRTFEQAEFLKSVLSIRGKFILLCIDVDFECLVARISGRFVCSKCNATYGAFDKITQCTVCGCDKFYTREDDKAELVRERIEKYKNITAGVLEFYKDCGCIFSVNGDLQPSEVSCSIDAIIERELNLNNL